MIEGQHRRSSWKEPELSRRLIVTNGVFDVLTVGHVELFAAIKRKFPDDRLLVLMNSDKSTKRLKGPSRPFNDQNSRERVLRALRDVDWVDIFDEDTPFEAMKRCQYDGWEIITVKGRGYQAHEIVAPPGVVRYVLGEDLNVSSTEIIEKMKNER